MCRVETRAGLASRGKFAETHRIAAHIAIFTDQPDALDRARDRGKRRAPAKRSGADKIESAVIDNKNIRQSPSMMKTSTQTAGFVCIKESLLI